ncbi:MAG: hypothetical protein GY941_18450 [Planctomycetes bacterium]|nr:hypothetical protein [Planctomycetota bacterium]
MEDTVYLVGKLGIPIVFMIVAVLGFVLLYRGKLGKLEIGKAIKISSVKEEADRIRSRMMSVESEGTARPTQQYALLQEYHSQGLAQSKISFWFSLVFASIGFAIIIFAAMMYIFEPASDIKKSIVDKAGKPIFAVVAGTIIDAVAALFFVQSNKARQLMTDFFDKLRVDRKLDESLNIISQIKEDTIASRVKALLSLNFAGVKVNDDTFCRIVDMAASTHVQNIIPEAQKTG